MKMKKQIILFLKKLGLIRPPKTYDTSLEVSNNNLNTNPLRKEGAWKRDIWKSRWKADE